MHAALGRIAIFLVALVVMLALADALLARIDPSLAPPPRRERVIRLREHAPNQDRWVRPTRDYMRGVDSLERKFYRLATDENGFLNPGRIHEQPDFVIVFMGGSTTECLYVDETNRFPYLVGRLLEARTGVRVNAFNAGHSGNHSMHSFNNLVNKVIPLRPDLVILSHNINDFATLLYEGTYWNAHPSRSLVVTIGDRPGLFRVIGMPLRAFPHLHTWLGALAHRVLSGSSEEDEFRRARGRKLVADIESISGHFEESLEQFVGVCARAGIAVVLMTQQNRFTPEPVDVVQRQSSEHFARQGLSWDQALAAYTAMNETTRRVAKRHGIPLVDLDARIPKTADYMYDMVHVNDRGSVAIAEIIASELESRLPNGVSHR